MRLSSISAIAASFGVASALRSTELTRIANGSFHLENIAVRSNGDLLINSFDNGRIYTLNPNEEDPQARVIAEIPELAELTGIAEVAPDVYAVTGGVQGEEGFGFKNGSMRAVLVNLNGCGDEDVVVRTIAKVDSPMLNGMVALPSKPHVVLSVDSIGGRMFRIDTATGHVEVAWSSDQLSPNDPPGVVPLGANGIDIYDGYLYFTNSDKGTYNRVPITQDGDLDGDFEEIWRRPEGSMRALDDFDMTIGGDTYSTLQQDSLIRISDEGETETLLGPDVEGAITLLSPTALALRKDDKVLYIVTGGGQVVEVEL